MNGKPAWSIKGRRKEIALKMRDVCQQAADLGKTTLLSLLILQLISSTFLYMCVS